jgi:hypothetical protein
MHITLHRCTIALAVAVAVAVAVGDDVCGQLTDDDGCECCTVRNGTV